jgi:hypothetical protein
MNRRQPLLPQNRDNSQPTLYDKSISVPLRFDLLGTVWLTVIIRSLGHWGVLFFFGWGVLNLVLRFVHFIIGN